MTTPTTPAPPGILYLIPNALDTGMGIELRSLDSAIPRDVMSRAAVLTHWIAENAKSARAFLKRVDTIIPLAQPLQSVSIIELRRPPKGSAPVTPMSMAALLQPALSGQDMGLISEAGLPAVADPGAAVVQAAHDANLRVIAMSGPSAITLALAASGLNGQNFAFVGYIPVEAEPRAVRIKELEALSKRQAQTQLLIETPYRNAALLGALLQHLRTTTLLSVTCGLTLPEGFSRTARVGAWRQASWVLPSHIPAVFALQADAQASA